MLPHTPYSPDLAPSDLKRPQQTSKKCILERNLALMKRKSPKMRPISWLFLNRTRTIKIVSKNYMTAIIVVSSSKGTILKKTEFYQKRVFFILPNCYNLYIIFSVVRLSPVVFVVVVFVVVVFVVVVVVVVIVMSAAATAIFNVFLSPHIGQFLLRPSLFQLLHRFQAII
jgi:hypothetical protein